MANLIFNSETFVVNHAVKGPDYVHGYDDNGKLIIAIEGVTNFAGITYDGEYMEPEQCLEESCNVVKFVNGRLVNNKGEGLETETYTEITMLASGWSGNQYSFEDLYPRESYNIEISLSPKATTQMIDAFNEATITGSADTNIATALGIVPTVDIIVLVKVVKK